MTTRYELQFVQRRPASFNPNVMIPERKTHIIEAESDDEADQKADLFLAGRTMISFHSLQLPPVIVPKLEFLPMDEIGT